MGGKKSLCHCVYICIYAEELVRSERGDISELMTTSFSETRTTEELLPAESEEEKEDEEEEEREFQNRPYPPRIGTPANVNSCRNKTNPYLNFLFFLLYKMLVRRRF